MKFRRHTGSYNESMATCIDFYTQKQLLDHIHIFQGEQIESIFSSRESVYDERCRWHTHNLMVKLASGEIYVAGQTNGCVEEFFAKDVTGAQIHLVREGRVEVDANELYESPRLEILFPGSKHIGEPPPIEFFAKDISTDNSVPEWVTQGYRCNVLPLEIYDFTDAPKAKFATNHICCVNCGSESYESDRRGHSWGLFTACRGCGHKHYWGEQDMMSGALYQFYLEAHGKDWPKEYYEYIKD